MQQTKLKWIVYASWDAGTDLTKTRRYHPPTDLDNNKNITVFFVERSNERNQGEILFKI